MSQKPSLIHDARFVSWALTGDTYVARLRREHGRKSSFWSLVE